MKEIWLVNPYGPIEGEDWREYSFNQFGKFLSQNDFRVIWWTASFSHHFKIQRSKGWKDVNVKENFIIRLVPTSSYKKNFGVGRLLKDISFSINAKKGFDTSKLPNIIIASENPMCMGGPAFLFAKKNQVPIIYDQMDIWPEFFVSVLPHPIDKLANILLKPICKKREKIYRCLDGSIALGKNYLDFMHRISTELINKPNALIYNGIDVVSFRKQLRDEVIHIKLQSAKPKNEIWCIFAGTLGPSYDIAGIIECAKLLEKQEKSDIKIFIAGSGPMEQEVIEAELELNNIIFLGKMLPKELIPIYGLCDIGLSTYSKGSNVDMCDKFYDYTAAGLAIINSLNGEIAEYIKNDNLGENYIANDINSLYSAILKFSNLKYLNIIKANSYEKGCYFDKTEQNNKLLICIQEVLEANNDNC